MVKPSKLSRLSEISVGELVVNSQLWNLGLVELFPRQRLLRRLGGSLLKLLGSGLLMIGLAYVLYGVLRLIGLLLNNGSR